MSEIDGRRTPSWIAVLREQFGAVGTLARREITVLGAGLAVLTVVAGTHVFLSGASIDVHPQAVAFPAALLGLFAPMAVWKDEPPSRRGYFWAMPVSRPGHTLAKTLDGWIWLMLIVAALLLWGLVVATLTGGEIGIREARLVSSARAAPGPISPEDISRVQWSTPLWLWLVPFTASTATYLLGTVPTLRSEQPWLWFGGLAVGYFLLLQMSQLAGLPELGSALRTVASGPHGLEVLTTGANEELAEITAEGGSRQEVWLRLPRMGGWIRTTLLWAGLGLAAVTAAAFRHPDA